MVISLNNEMGANTGADNNNDAVAELLQLFLIWSLFITFKSVQHWLKHNITNKYDSVSVVYTMECIHDIEFAASFISNAIK